MAIWDDVIGERDRQVYAAAGYGGRGTPGRRPAVLVIDVTYNFVGDRPAPILESIARFPNSCGEAGWQVVYNLRRLLQTARQGGFPIIYSTGERHGRALAAGRWADKHVRALEEDADDFGNQIVAEIAPAPEDLVIVKKKPSAFFGTPLMSYLNELDVDTLIVTGATTSGCVRATVIDAFSYNFRLMVVEECTCDRGELSHKVNLFDMHAKYADIVSLEAAESYLTSLTAERSSRA